MNVRLSDTPFGLDIVAALSVSPHLALATRDQPRSPEQAFQRCVELRDTATTLRPGQIAEVGAALSSSQVFTRLILARSPDEHAAAKVWSHAASALPNGPRSKALALSALHLGAAGAFEEAKTALKFAAEAAPAKADLSDLLLDVIESVTSPDEVRPYFADALTARNAGVYASGPLRPAGVVADSRFSAADEPGPTQSTRASDLGVDL